jgi:hypothetical protein
MLHEENTIHSAGFTQAVTLCASPTSNVLQINAAAGVALKSSVFRSYAPPQQPLKLCVAYG